jgi:L-threonylcarbamoyladenylate synthase
MKARLVKQSDQNASTLVLETLRARGVIAFATDTVYGIGCLASDGMAIERVYAIKERDRLKAIPVLIGSLDQLPQVAQDIPPAAQNLTSRFWPGALTVILKKNPALPPALTIYGTVGVRMPDHDWLRGLIQVSGPLAVTSANISGQPSLASADEVMASLAGRIDLLIDGEHCDGGIPSTVVDCTVQPVKILRDGALKEQVLQSIQ